MKVYLLKPSMHFVNSKLESKTACMQRTEQKTIDEFDYLPQKEKSNLTPQPYNGELPTLHHHGGPVIVIPGHTKNM